MVIPPRVAMVRLPIPANLRPPLGLKTQPIAHPVADLSNPTKQPSKSPVVLKIPYGTPKVRIKIEGDLREIWSWASQKRQKKGLTETAVSPYVVKSAEDRT